MIGFIRWLRSRPSSDAEPDLSHLDAQHDEAVQEREEAREIRRKAERVGPAAWGRVENNHLTEGFAAAFERQRRHA